MFDSVDLLASEDGQALIELFLVVVLCLIFAFGLFETGVYLHNLSVLNRAANNAAVYAAHGAPVEEVRGVFIRESRNLLAGAFLEQRIDRDGLVVLVWNPVTDSKVAPPEIDSFPFDEPRLAPGEENVAPYLFWTPGYEIRTGIKYHVGIYLPLLGPVTAGGPIAGSNVVQSAADLDRDGLVDSWEPGYVQYWLRQAGDTDWVHPSHRDYTAELDTQGDSDIDGDGTVQSADTFPYDYDNDGTEDKFDFGDNLLDQNPVAGP